MEFETEYDMSLKFKKFIHTNILDSNIKVFEEFKGLFGIPDYLLVEKNVNSVSTIVTFELKLSNWKRALKQAYKYKSFSNICYVVLDEAFLYRATNNIDLFVNSNIGLASFNYNNELKIYFNPKISEPFSQFYLEKVLSILKTKKQCITKKHKSHLLNSLSSFIADIKPSCLTAP